MIRGKFVNIFSFSFLSIWIVAFIYGFLRGLRYRPELKVTIADYISNLTGNEFRPEWVSTLLWGIAYSIMIMWIIFDRYYYDVINFFKKKLSSNPSRPTLYKKKSKSSRKKKKRK